MDASLVISLCRDALRLALVLGAPPLLAAFAVALLVGAFQTVTQLQEPIVAQIPRQAIVMVVVLLCLPWLIGTWVEYVRALLIGLGSA